MKRLLHFTFILFFNFVFSQGFERFTQSNLTDTYSNGNFLGETSGVSIFYYHCRNAGDFPIDGEGIMLRRNDIDPVPSSVEIHIPNGVGEFTFQYRKAFTNDNNRILSVSVNDEEIFLSPIFGTEEETTIYTQTIPVYKQGNVIIKIAYPSTIANGNRQITLDNFSWTKILPNPSAIPSEYVSVDNFIANWEYSHDFDFFEISVSDYKNRVFTQTESFERGLDTSGYEELWEAELIGGRWILDNVLRTTQHTNGNYGAQLQADFGKLISPIFQKPKSISFYAKKGVNNTSLNLSLKIGDIITSLQDFEINNSEFQLYSFNLNAIPDEASFIFTNGSRVLYLDELSIESEGFLKLPIVNSPFESNSLNFSHHIKNLEPNIKYFYQVRALYNGDSSGNSNEIELMTDDGVVWDGNDWQFGNPSENKVAVLRGNGNNLTTFQAKSLKVESDIVIPSGTFIRLIDYFKNHFQNSIIFNEGAYLIQANNEAVNYGNATFKRNAAFYGYDTKFWSSPVLGQKILKASATDIAGFIHNPSAVFNYNESGRNWLRTQDSNFEPTKGYAIQLGANYPFMGQGQETPFDGIFTGIPNNGEFRIQVTKSSLGDNGVGNPYGSPISIDSFMNRNPSVKTLYFWNEEAHYIPGSSPASYNAQTWFSCNSLGCNDNEKDHIGPGVGFIARVLEDSEIVFNNSMRNDPSSTVVLNRNSTQKDRFWLSLNSENKKENQILIGYVEGATNGIDDKYDAKNLSNANSFILSHSNNNAMIIEGRQYPLDVNDQIPLYFRAKNSGDYTIKLEKAEGIFSSQPIYLIDNELNLSINLSEVSEYTFDTVIGDFATRFEIRYQPKETLNTSEFNHVNDLIIYTKDKTKYVFSKENVTAYSIYNLAGQRVSVNKINHLKEFNLEDLTSGTYIIKFNVEGGKVITKQILY